MSICKGTIISRFKFLKNCHMVNIKYFTIISHRQESLNFMSNLIENQRRELIMSTNISMGFMPGKKDIA